MWVTDRHDMTLAVKVAFNRNTTNHLLKQVEVAFESFIQVRGRAQLVVLFLFLGHYCPNETQTSNQYPCPAGTYNNLTGFTASSDCLPCLGRARTQYWICNNFV